MAVRQPNAQCEVCGTDYWVQSTRLATSRFCSNACKSAGHAPTVSKDELARLYYEQLLSMQQIAKRLGCSQHKIAYWMDQYDFERRDISDAVYIQRNPDGDPFMVKMPITNEEWKLFGIGIGLYIGEGSKRGTAVMLANTSPKIHRTFIRFLEGFCGVSKNQLKASLNIYDDRDVVVAMAWWADQLGLKDDQFYAPTIRASRGAEYIKRSLHGTLTIIFNNTRLKRIIEDWYADYY